MARYEPGQSGNPRGRPPKERALTAILQAELGRRWIGFEIDPAEAERAREWLGDVA